MWSELLDVSLYRCPHGHQLVCEHYRGEIYVRCSAPHADDPYFCFYLLLRVGQESRATATQVREMLVRAGLYSAALPPETIPKTDGRGRTWYIVLNSPRVLEPQMVCQDTWFVTGFPPNRRDAVDFPDDILAWAVGVYYNRDVTMYDPLIMRGPPDAGRRGGPDRG
jgi:hypothetical protein